LKEISEVRKNADGGNNDNAGVDDASSDDGNDENNEDDNTGNEDGKCSGNCPGGLCDDCVCGIEQEIVEIYDECSANSDWSLTCCSCIAWHESRYNTNAINFEEYDGSYSVGLWQINSVNWENCNGGEAPCDVASNLKCAKDIWKWAPGGDSWYYWSTASMCGCKTTEEEQAKKAAE